MMTHDLVIRTAVPEDAEALLAIYAPYVKETAVTFEYEVPSLQEFSGRIASTLPRYPYLVAQVANTPVGYAYASLFHARAAYRWCAEISIYLHQRCRGQGIGQRLYGALEQELRRQGVLNLYACIAYPNPPSIRFHKKQGFQTIGHFHQCGWKLGKWYDMIWMEKLLSSHQGPPRPVVPFSE